VFADATSRPRTSPAIVAINPDILCVRVEMPFRQAVAQEHAEQGAREGADERDKAGQQRADDLSAAPLSVLRKIAL
jgi:hypothetical protein